MIAYEALREAALAFPGATEAPHFEKTSFRVRQKIFATYDAAAQRACLKLTDVDQSVFAEAASGSIYLVPNSWGRRGWTFVDLKTAPKQLVLEALRHAYDTAATPKAR